MTTLLDPPVARTPARPPRRPPLALALGALVLLAVLLVAVAVRLPGLRQDTDPAASAGATSSEAAPAPDAVAVAPEGGAAPLGRVVRTGSVSLVADDGRTTQVLDAVQRAAAAAGAQVFGSRTQESGDAPSGSLVLRVRSEGFDDLVLRVRALAPVRSATATGEDVTAEVADLEAQVRSLRAARERFLAILGRADTVSEVLSVQQQVDDVTGRLDQVEAQARVLRDSSDFSTLTVDVAEDGDVAVQTGGLGAALADARDGFLTGVEVLVRVSGPLLLLGLCLLAGLGVARVARRVRPRR